MDRDRTPRGERLCRILVASDDDGVHDQEAAFEDVCDKSELVSIILLRYRKGIGDVMIDRP